MKKLPVPALLAAAAFATAILAASCSGSFEKYVTSHRGILLSYDQGYAFTALTPAGWKMDRASAASNNYSFWITPDNAPGVAVYSYGIVIPKDTDGLEDISNNIRYLYHQALLTRPDAVLDTETNRYRIDRARNVHLFILNNNGGKQDFYRVYTYAVWKRSAVAVVYQAEDYRSFVFHYDAYEHVLNSIRFWGEDAKPLIATLKRLSRKAAQKRGTN